MLDILTMFDHMRITLNVLDRNGGTKGIDRSRFEFDGFDGNHDWQLDYTRYLVKTKEIFTDLLGEEPPNSHGTRLPLYRRMLPIWTAFVKAKGYDLEKITREEMIDLQNRLYTKA